MEGYDGHIERIVHGFVHPVPLGTGYMGGLDANMVTLGDVYCSFGEDDTCRSLWLKALDEDDMLALSVELADREMYPEKFEYQVAE